MSAFLPLLSGVRLAWVVHGDTGRACHVSTFATLPRQERPAVFCPTCHRPVTLRLGPRNVHHAAHHRGALCATTAPESALHLNCKLHIAEELRRASELEILQPCQSAADARLGCEEQVARPWLAGWDRVEVEHQLGSRRPDILLLRGDTPVGAIEVCVRNPVSAEKEQDLATLGVPWIEVRGSEALIVPHEPWTAAVPLPTTRRWPDSPQLCSSCAIWDTVEERKRALWEVRVRAEIAARRVLAGQQVELQRRFFETAPTLQERTRRSGIEIARIRLFDAYATEEPRVRRAALFLGCVYERGRVVRAVSGVTRPLQVLATAESPRAPDYWGLQAAAQEHLHSLSRDGQRIDSPTSWFALPLILRDASFVRRWQSEGFAHRWERARSPPAALPLRLLDTDFFDLLRYFLRCYAVALPHRYAWQAAIEGWQRFAGDDRWRLWPDD